MSGRQPWQAFAALPVRRIAEIPHPRDGGARDTGSAQRMQALVSASGSSDPVAVGWVCERAGGPVTVLAGGAGLAGGHDESQTVLTLPPGARGAPPSCPATTIAAVSGSADVTLIGRPPSRIRTDRMKLNRAELRHRL